jgi:hypothetical protein
MRLSTAAHRLNAKTILPLHGTPHLDLRQQHRAPVRKLEQIGIAAISCGSMQTRDVALGLWPARLGPHGR